MNTKPNNCKNLGTQSLSYLGTTKRNAFTLAEVLITLGIIGIIAAMTLPTLITKYQKKQTVTQLKKAYTTLYQAIELSELKNGDKENWNFDLPSEEFINTYLTPFMKISENNAAELNAQVKYKFLNGNDNYDYIITKAETKTITLPDGTMLFVDAWSSGNNISRTILIDINGLKKPNTLGKDMFAFYVTRDLKPQIVPSMTLKLYPNQKNPVLNREDFLRNEKFLCNKLAESPGYGCAGVIMADGWEIKDDYPW